MEVKHKIAHVIWEDSSETYGWHDIEPLSAEPVWCVSVGFIIRQTKEAIVLALSLGNLGSGMNQANGIMTIPKSAIRSMKVKAYK